jgi:hypothetical protein
MIFVKLQKENDTRAFVTMIHSKPENIGINTEEDAIAKGGILLTEVPEPEAIQGKTAKAYVNPQTKEFWYEYVDRPLTPEEKLQLLEQENQDLKNRIDLMQQALDELLLGGM